jgi:hypothetical protein
VHRVVAASPGVSEPNAGYCPDSRAAPVAQTLWLLGRRCVGFHVRWAGSCRRIARWVRSKTDTSIVKWGRVLVVLAAASGNDVATIDRAGRDEPISLRALAKKALHRDSNR